MSKNKQTVYDKSVAKVNAIDRSRFVLKTKYDTDQPQRKEKKINDTDKKIPDASRLDKETYYNANITEIEGKIPSITGLATSAALTTVENKTSNVSNLVKKKDCDTKISNIESKYFTAADYKKFTSQTLDANIKQRELVSKITFTHEKKVNIHIVYEINLWDQGYDDSPTIEDSWFAAVKLVKDVDIDKYKYSGYDIGFGRRGAFSVANGFGRNVIIFGVDMLSSVNVDNKKKDISIFGEGPTQELDNTTLTAEINVFS